MGDQDAWNAATFLQNSQTNITLAQLMHIPPKARTSLAEALRLTPMPENKAAQKHKAKAAAKTFVEEVSQVEMDYTMMPEEAFAAELGGRKPVKNKRLLATVAHIDTTDVISAVYDTASDALRHSTCPDCRESALNPNYS
jgi:hypothetical protein